jgi:trans-aconitate methyltransferase
MASNEATKSGYWEGYYAEHSRDTPQPPSQFAAFVIQEVQPMALAIDIGCGSGRDTLIFARHDVRALGIDGSHVVIDNCSASAAKQNVPNLSFECTAVESSDLGQILVRALEGIEGTAVAYARFFLHAITEDEQRHLLDTLEKNLRKGDIFAAEFRTTRDAPLSKVTEQHYRRYVAPSSLVAEMAVRGFETTYMVEGFGYAKYKNDDAHVARLLFRKEKA